MHNSQSVISSNINYSNSLIPNVVTPLNGLPFDSHQTRWSFNDGVDSYSLNFSKLSSLATEIMVSAQIVLIWYAENSAGGSLRSHFEKLCLLIDFIAENTKDEVTAITSTDLINYRNHLGREKEWYLGSLAAFLKKWHKLKLPGVTEDVVKFFAQVKLKGIVKGKAVRTMDPEKGPFSDIELESIRDAVNRKYSDAKISKFDFTLTWLFILLGQRPKQFALLKVCDINRKLKNDGTYEYVLSVPKIKQETQQLRDEFTQRILNPSFGEILFKYAEEVESGFVDLIDEPKKAPLFPAQSIRKNQPHEFFYHTSPKSLTLSVKAVIGSLKVSSERTGKQLVINSYRFRYTTGTRASREGHGELIIAELLDHSDTQNVQVYTEFTPEIVQRIDKALAMRMAPLASAFSGNIIFSEADAARGKDMSSRILDPRIDASMRPMGNCAKTGTCGFIAPIACYTCKSFQAWADGPHDKVLNYLLSERERLLLTTDERIATINDRTILAVADVVHQCELQRSSITNG